MPAKVAGTWKIPQGELALTQRFQNVTGTLQSGSAGAPVTVTGKLNGEEIAFSGGGVEYTGRVNGNTMSVTARPGGSWTATRAGR